MLPLRKTLFEGISGALCMQEVYLGGATLTSLILSIRDPDYTNQNYSFVDILHQDY